MGGAVVFTWLGASRVYDQLIDSLQAIPDHDVGDAIVRFAFEMTEDLYASPAWWDQLPADDRARLLRRMETGGVPLRHSQALLDDGLRVARRHSYTRTRDRTGQHSRLVSFARLRTLSYEMNVQLSDRGPRSSSENTGRRISANTLSRRSSGATMCSPVAQFS